MFNEQMIAKYHDGLGVLAEVSSMVLRGGDTLYIGRLIRPGVTRMEVSRGTTPSGNSVYVTREGVREPDVIFASQDSRDLETIHDWLRELNFNVPVASCTL